MTHTVGNAATKKEIWESISNGANVVYKDTINREMTGVMVKGEFRTKGGVYEYICNEFGGSYTINEILSVKIVS